MKTTLTATGGLLLLAPLYIGRWLGLIGVSMLLFRLIGWYKHYNPWLWVAFILIGILCAKWLEDVTKWSKK
jgi:hypothetical protein